MVCVSRVVYVDVDVCGCVDVCMCVCGMCVEGERERVTIMRPIPHDSSAHSCYRTPAELQCRS